MSRMIILSGIAGSGKTTFAQEFLKGEPDFTLVSADSFFMTPKGYKFDPSRLSEAHGTCFYQAIEAVQYGKELMVDNTNLTALEIAPYYCLAQSYGYSVGLITFQISPWTAERNQHGVPRATLERMFLTLKDRKLPPFWKLEQTEIRDFGV